MSSTTVFDKIRSPLSPIMSSLTKVKDLQVAGGFFMYQKVYIDIVFAANLIMDYVLLRLVGRTMRCKCRRIRCAAAAVMGAFFSCVLLFIPAVRYQGVLILFHCICAMGMVRIAYGIKKGALLLKTLLMLYLTAFLWGGFWEAFLKNKRMTVQLFLLTALSTYGILGTLLLVGDHIRICRRNIYPVTIFFAGKKSASYGFYDTGNLLTDPFSEQPVSIVQTEILEELLGKNLLERLKYMEEKPGELKSTEIVSLKPHYLSLKTIGQEEKRILAVTLEKLCIQTPGEEVCITDPVMALTFEPSALGREYKVLINSRLLH